MKVAVQITGWHPRWNPVASIKAISSAAGLVGAKGIVSAAQFGEQPSFDVDGDVKATALAQELAGLGAVVACNGVIYDSYPGEERGIPYRKKAVGTMLTKAASDEDTYTGRITRGIVFERFALSMPLTGGLDLRVAAIVIGRDRDQIIFRIQCDDPAERQLWRQLLKDGEVDIHKPR